MNRFYKSQRAQADINRQVISDIAGACRIACITQQVTTNPEWYRQHGAEVARQLAERLGWGS